jgi:hypothetical protein
MKSFGLQLWSVEFGVELRGENAALVVHFLREIPMYGAASAFTYRA